MLVFALTVVHDDFGDPHIELGCWRNPSVLTTLSIWLSRAALLLSAMGLVAMTLIIGGQVFARYVLDASPAWTEQAALYLMLWFILFASAAGVREGFHIRLSLLQDKLPPHARALLAQACYLLVAVFGVFMAIGGAELALETWHHKTPTLGLSRGTAFFPMAGAGALIVFFSLEHVIAIARGREVEKLWR